MQNGPEFDVAILGGGPAGAGAAVALARRGAKVLLVARAAEDGWEGLSPRSVALVRAQRLEHAAAVVGPLLPRLALWGGERLDKGGEHLVSRRALHEALGADARAAGATVVPGVATTVTSTDRGVDIAAGAASFRAACVVEARGRRLAAPRARGPRLLSLVCGTARLDGIEPGSRVVALADGWCWAIALPDGSGALQFVGAPRDGDDEPWQRLQAAAQAHELLRPWAAALNAGAAIVARAATATLGATGDLDRAIPAGDALVALDPLSGQGVYEALSAVPMTVAAVRGMLDGDDPALRTAFVNERAAAVWSRTVAAASGFYGVEADRDGQPFWRDAVAAYRRAALPAAAAPAAPRVEWRPVLNDTRIERARVVVTADEPRGAWRLDGIELASVCDALAELPGADVDALAERCGQPVGAVARAVQWLRRAGFPLNVQAGRAGASVAVAAAGG